jgi:hypothetical protein
MKAPNIAPCVTAALIQFSLASITYAADLSEGMKSLKLGITKENALKVLENQEQQRGKTFAPYCTPEPLGENCSALITGLTYGNIPLLMWTIHLGRDGRLARVELLLSKSGCTGSGAGIIHPQLQFESLSTLLERQYGKPASERKDAVVWVDQNLNAALVLQLYSRPIYGIEYPDCPVTTISLSTVDYLEKLIESKSRENVRKSDL